MNSGLGWATYETLSQKNKKSQHPPSPKTKLDGTCDLVTRTFPLAWVSSPVWPADCQG